MDLCISLLPPSFSGWHLMEAHSGRSQVLANGWRRLIGGQQSCHLIGSPVSTLFCFFLQIHCCFLHSVRFSWLREQRWGGSNLKCMRGSLCHQDGLISRSPDWQCNFTLWKLISLSSFIMNNFRQAPEQMKGRWGRRQLACVAPHVKHWFPTVAGNLLSRHRDPHWGMRTFILRSIDQLPACLVRNQVARI